MIPIWDALDGTGLLIYTRTGGNDTNDGKTWANANALPSGSVSDATDGGCIFIAPGTYTDTVSITDTGKVLHFFGITAQKTKITSASTTFSAEIPVVLENLWIHTSGGSAIVSALSLSRDVGNGTTPSPAIIRNCRITNDSGTDLAEYSLKAVVDTGPVIFENCLIESAGKTVYAASGGPIIFRNCLITSTGPTSSGQSTPLYIGSASVFMENCIVDYSLSAAGAAALYCGFIDSTDSVFIARGCKFILTTDSSETHNAFGFYVAGDNALFQDCVIIVNNAGSGEAYSFVGGGSNTVNVLNTVYDSARP